MGLDSYQLKSNCTTSHSHLHNAAGHHVFKSEPAAENYQPNEAEPGIDFISWLKKNFGWRFAQAQASASLGTAHVYADGCLSLSEDAQCAALSARRYCTASATCVTCTDCAPARSAMVRATFRQR